MPGTTTNLALRYPVAPDAPDGAGGFLNLASDIDQMLRIGGAESVANAAALAAIPAARIFQGKLVYQADVDMLFRYNGTGWTLWQGDAAITYGSSLTDIGGAQKSSIARSGRVVTVNLEALTSSGGVSGAGLLLSLPTGFRPLSGRTFMGSMWLINTDGTTNTVVRVAARWEPANNIAGGLYFQSYGLANNQSFGGAYRMEGSMTFPGEA